MGDFNITTRVYYEDTDAGGIVYHANYIKFMERARTDWLRQFGVSQQNLFEQSIGFVVIDMQIKFKASAKLDDLLKIDCQLIKLSKASLVLQQTVKKQNQTLVVAQVKIACVNTSTNKPHAIPAEIIKEISSEQ